MRSKSSYSYSSIQVEELCHVKSELDVLITGRKGLMSTDHVVKSSTGETSMGCFNVPARTTSMFVELFGKFEWVAAYHGWL
ncbi:hypothetical protein FEM48_Zijuj03G0054200 [Ziziphus jujuba var. spinosa]|uniref:Uncharacterized protein n=1 Tax=Ziziphus jujuba var. spinosa TaxID=714518 RepID=A0A978VNF6_ZIZJJ|nr:hypothetical protein FEM48_Zijuj03G0054200 [Ziziphus jujuba var. spinosa]